MRTTLFLLTTIVLMLLTAIVSCDNSTDTNKTRKKDSTASGSDSTKRKQEPETCLLGEEVFESTAGWPEKLFEPSEDIDGYVQYAADINFAPGEMGLMTYLRKADSTFILLFVEVIDSVNQVKPVGSKIAAPYSKDISFHSHCFASCLKEPVLGLYSVDQSDRTHTVQSWWIDKKRKAVFKVNPNLVSCQDAHETDYD